jgi:hypothetical protein
MSLSWMLKPSILAELAEEPEREIELSTELMFK